VDDLMGEICTRTERGERILVTTITTKMAEDLTEYLELNLIKVKYIHHHVETMERSEIIRDLRLGKFDVLVGINLLREGLDIPEVSLVAILDADKEGLLRSETALIQTIGRAARNVEGTVIMYADNMTRSMRAAIEETDRRRRIQNAYNIEHGITPESVRKSVRDLIEIGKSEEKKKEKGKKREKVSVKTVEKEKQPTVLTDAERDKLIAELTREMTSAAMNLDFERAAQLRDRITALKTQN
jgi:excinuclease ABC subunit B